MGISCQSSQLTNIGIPSLNHHISHETYRRIPLVAISMWLVTREHKELASPDNLFSVAYDQRQTSLKYE